MNKTLLLCFFLSPSLLNAQVVGGDSEGLYHFEWAAANEQFGSRVADMGDLNQDGYDDLLVGHPLANPNGLGVAGSVYVYSGQDGSLLLQIDGQSFGQRFGTSVASLNDTNADGIREIIVGAPYAEPGGLAAAGSVFVYDGATGQLKFRFDGTVAGDFFGNSVADSGDINQDGVPDILVGSPLTDVNGFMNSGSVFTFSGFTGAQLNRWDGVADYDNFGYFVSGGGFIDNDGFPDILVGAPLDQAFGGFNNGVVYAYSGLFGTQIHRWDGPTLNANMGRNFASIGDVDGDGTTDILIGSPAESGVIGNEGAAFLYSGSTGALIAEWYGNANSSRMGQAVAGVGDINFDGRADFLISSSSNIVDGIQVGSVFLISGMDFTILHQWNGRQSGDSFGSDVSTAGDVNNDGRTDVFLASPFANPFGLTDAGSCHVFSFHPFMSADESRFSANSGGTINFTLDFLSSAANLNYMTLMSVRGTGPVRFGIDIPLSMDSFLMDSSNGSYPFPVHQGMHGSLDSLGKGSASITFAPGLANAAIGLTLWFAGVTVPSGQVLPSLSSVAVPIVVDP